MPRQERTSAPTPRPSRRRVLASVAGVGVSTLFGSVASGRVGALDSAAGSAGDSLGALSLGSFESGLDGWSADGALDLTRVSRADRPVAVTAGGAALEATASGASAPAVRRSVATLGLGDRPYFLADVAPGRIKGTDAPVAFRFRLYDLLDGEPDPVATSDPVTVRQAAPGRIFWDASDADPDLLDAAAVLAVEWRPADRDWTDELAYRGGVVLDAVRATDSPDAVASARLAATMRRLQFDHGPYVRTEVTAESDAAEEGAFVFADGATEPYRFEILGADRCRLTVAGTAMRFGGGWA